MGYGGALIYSGLARNLKAHFPERNVVFVYPWNLDELIWRRAAHDRRVWRHNDDIALVIDSLRWFFMKRRHRAADSIAVNVEDPRYFYWTRAVGNRIEYKQGKHAIQIACDVHGITAADLQPKIVLTVQEEAAVDRLLEQHRLRPGQYLCIEPHAKDTFSPNKAWFWDRWQAVVRRLTRQFAHQHLAYQIAQVGTGHSRVLAGVVDLTGKTTFRETAAVLARSRLLVSTEGGLPHLARAVGTPAVVLLSAVLPPELVAYPGNTNLYADQSCVCRGTRTPCPRGRACMAVITVDAVVTAILTALARAPRSIGQPTR